MESKAGPWPWMFPCCEQAVVQGGAYGFRLAVVGGEGSGSAAAEQQQQHLQRSIYNAADAIATAAAIQPDMLLLLDQLTVLPEHFVDHRPLGLAIAAAEQSIEDIKPEFIPMSSQPERLQLPSYGCVVQKTAGVLYITEARSSLDRGGRRSKLSVWRRDCLHCARVLTGVLLQAMALPTHTRTHTRTPYPPAPPVAALSSSRPITSPTPVLPRSARPPNAPCAVLSAPPPKAPSSPRCATAARAGRLGERQPRRVRGDGFAACPL